ncbi:MAG: DUF5667 domain-containing protein, partial [Dehalococcoidia bacterium]
MANKFEKTLDECLNRVITGGEGIEHCLRDYPEMAEGLEPLLRTALAVKVRADSVQPRTLPRSLAKQRFLTEVRAAGQPQPRRRWFPGFQGQRRWVVAVTVGLIVILVGGGGTVAAAAGSMPDEPLYPVKIATEQARLAFARTEIGRAEIEARFADRRVKEIARMSEKHKAAKVEVATNRLAKHLDRIAKAAGIQKARGGVTERDVAKLRDLLEQYAAKHPGVLQRALETAPPQTRAMIFGVLEKSKKRYAAAIQDVNIAARANKGRQPDGEARGRIVGGDIKLITDSQWIVDGEVVNIDARTIIQGTPQVGAGARIEVITQPDGSLLAKKI